MITASYAGDFKKTRSTETLVQLRRCLISFDHFFCDYISYCHMGGPVTRYRLINPSPERGAQMALAFIKYIPEFKLLLKSPSDWYQAPFPEVVLLWLKNEAIIFSRTLSICLDCNLAPALAPKKWSRSGPKSLRNMYSLYLAADAEIADHTHVFKILKKCCLIVAMLAVLQPVFEYQPGPGHNNNNNNNSTSMQPYHYDTDRN